VTAKPLIRLGKRYEYGIIIQAGRGQDAPLIAGVRFPRGTPRRVVREWRDIIRRGMQVTSR
jgi:hypothetical protein